MRFKHFFGSGKLFENFAQRFICIHASRASWKLIFDALKSCGRRLFNAYRFNPQLAILLHKMGKRIGAFCGMRFWFHYYTKNTKTCPKNMISWSHKCCLRLLYAQRPKIVSN